MNKYEEAFDVIETILHLMCGEEREDGYKPSQDEMSNSMEDFKELVKKETPKKILEVSKEEYALLLQKMEILNLMIIVVLADKS